MRWAASFLVAVFLMPCGVTPFGMPLVRAYAQEATTPSEAPYDSLHTMLSLNMAIMSIFRITKSPDRVVLDQEYRHILNNFAYGNVADDEELMGLYEAVMDNITA